MVLTGRGEHEPVERMGQGDRFPVLRRCRDADPDAGIAAADALKYINDGG